MLLFSRFLNDDIATLFDARSQGQDNVWSYSASFVADRKNFKLKNEAAVKVPELGSSLRAGLGGVLKMIDPPRPGATLRFAHARIVLRVFMISSKCSSH